MATGSEHRAAPSLETEGRNRMSVGTFVVLILAVTATCLMTLMGGIYYLQETREERGKLHMRLEADAGQLSTSLSLPLWNFDEAQVEKILDSAMKDENVWGVIVEHENLTDPLHPRIFSRARDARWQVIQTEDMVFPPGTVMVERPIEGPESPIGRVQVLVSTRRLEEELRERLVFSFGSALLVDLVLIVTLYLVLWKAVLKPLRAIDRYAARVQAGEMTLPDSRTSWLRELASLRTSLGRMVSLLHARLRALQDQGTTLTAVLDSVPQSIYWRGADGRLLGWNQVFSRMGGKALSEGRDGQGDPQPSDHPATPRLAEDLEVIRTGAARIHVIEPFQGTDGRTVWIDSTRVPMLDGSGKPYAVLGVFEDISERRHAEEERIRLQEHLNQAQKLESVGRLAGGVAHDNNNMLTAILMHAELLREHLGGANSALRHIQAIESAAGRSTALIRQLLAFSRKQVVEPQVLDLNAQLVQFQTSMAPLVGEDIEFIFKPGEALWPVLMDPSQLDQIVMNLVVNARDAMPTGGTLSIETAHRRIDAHYCAENSWATPGDFVVLSVSDTGIGMSQEVQQKIFDPFFTTKEVGKGTGLGLSTVFGIVKQNRGFINVYSEPGLGATFRIHLPRAQKIAESPTGMDGREIIQQGAGRILVVEDEEILRGVIPQILDRLGYSYLLADTPMEALRICGQPGFEVDALLTDVVMPGMSGRELCEKLRALRPDLKVIYMSGYTADVISRQGILEDDAQFIQKPFSTAELGGLLKRVLGN